MNFLFKILFYCMILSQAMSYYFYNAKSKQVLSTSTLNVPKGYRIMQPPKTLKFNREVFTHGLYCQDIGFSCTQKLNYSLTYQFECENDRNCPKSFICCPQKCFKHNVCTKAATKLISRNSNKNLPSIHDNNRCEKWPYNCYQPYPAYFTYKFKCDYDEQCLKEYKCCHQSCFTHKICSKSYKKVENLKKGEKDSTKISNTNYENAEKAHMPFYGKGIIGNTENAYLQSNYSVKNSTDLIRTTREVERVTEQNESITEGEENSTEEDSPTTHDPNGIFPDYSDYYEN